MKTTMKTTMKTRYEILSELHPDTNGGDTSRIAEFMAMLRKQRNICRCGCRAALRYGRQKYLDAMHFRAHRLGRRVKAIASALVLLACGATASEVTLAWDYPTPTPPNIVFLLYGTTNAALTQATLTNAQIVVNCGTNKTVKASSMTPGVWKWAVVASIQGIKSDLSNVLQTEVPFAPMNVRTVVEP